MYGILYFSSKSRVQVTGVMFRCVYGDRQEYIVHTKKTHHKDMWAKVSETRELMEIIGPTGDYEAELTALKGAHGFLYKYPNYPLTGEMTVPIRTDFHITGAYTFDNAHTLDRDDAISISSFPNPDGDHTKDYTVLGIHITDVARYLYSTHKEWFSWARQKAASGYWKHGTKPMLPPTLSHDTLSLTEGKTHECLSLLMKYKNVYTEQGVDYELEMVYLTPCHIKIDGNLTYDDLPHHSYFPFLTKMCGLSAPTEIIEWCMIQYNAHMAVNIPDVLLRVQDENEKARYDYTGRHFTMHNRLYTHATSPIRRFADFYNQCMYYSSIDDRIDTPLLTMEELTELNDRMDTVREFHNREVVMSLAYECKDQPMVVTGRVYVDEDGDCILLQLANKTIRVPLADCYYEEAIYDAVKYACNDQISVECVGIHKHGMASLRVRLIEVPYTQETVAI
jgi:exoribonuclease R